jgi:hypothetical protein
MNFDATPYGMSLDVRVYRQKNIYTKIYNFNKMHQRIEYDILELAISIVNVFLNGGLLLSSKQLPTDLRPPPCHVNHDGISV